MQGWKNLGFSTCLGFQVFKGFLKIFKTFFLV